MLLEQPRRFDRALVAPVDEDDARALELRPEETTGAR